MTTTIRHTLSRWRLLLALALVLEISLSLLPVPAPEVEAQGSSFDPHLQVQKEILAELRQIKAELKKCGCR